MKYINTTFFFLMVFFSFFHMSSNQYAQAINPEVPPVPADPPFLEQRQTITPIEKVSPGIFRIGDILLNKKSRGISFPAQVNMDKGLLEYLLVSSSGKTHESLFRTKVKPYDLQLAFLLLGFEGTDKPLEFQGSPETPKGDPVEITIKYNNNKGQTIKSNPEEWMVKVIENTKKKIGKLDWVYTGSLIVNGQFLAQVEGSIAAVFHDPTAMIDNASKGGESDEIWYVKEGTVPPVGTSVTIIIKAKK